MAYGKGVAYSDYDNDGKIDIVRSNGAGNVDVDGDLENEIIQAKNYYPFGLQIKHGANSALSIVNGRNHKYGFGGKEYQDELNLAWYDITARNYDAALGRWMNIDPLAEQMRRHSPYNYAFDNPIYWTDPDGRAPQDIILHSSLTKEQRQKSLAELQKLTDDKLKYNSSTGRVDIVSRGTGKKKTGTKMIRDLIGHSKNVTIKYDSSQLGSSAEADNKTNEKNGVGSNSTVTIGGTNAKTLNAKKGGKRETEAFPDEIALGHELIHALADMNGESKSHIKDYPHEFKNQHGETEVEEFCPEEYYTIGFSGYDRFPSPKTGKYATENSLRAENGYSPRVAYSNSAWGTKAEIEAEKKKRGIKN